METSKVDERVYTDVEERYPRYLVPALALIVLDVLLAATLFRRFP
jgi:hypothetical protein